MYSKPRRFVRRRWVGTAVAISWLILYSGLGGVIARAQAGSMFALLVATLLALRMPDTTLIHLRRLSGFWRGMALLGIPLALGLVVVPTGFPEWTTLDNTQFHNGSSWHTLSVDPEATVTAVALWVLYLSLGTFAGIWATRKQFHREQRKLAISWLMVVLVFAFGHLAFEQHSVFGLITTSIGENRPFFAPFVNDTHLGTMILFLVPPAAFAVQSWSGVGRSVLALVLSCSVLALFVGISSNGAWGILAFVLISIVGFSGGTAIRIATGALTVAGASAGLLSVYSSHRWVAWWEALTILGEFPIAGTGIGGFERTFAARHSSVEFSRWSHLHNDPLQWLLESGFLGAGFGVVGVYLLLGFGTLRQVGTASWALGMAAVALHGLIEFPTHIPALMGAVAIALGMMHGGRSRADNGRWPVSRIRFMLKGLAIIQAAATIWFLRTSVQEEAVAEALAWQQEPAVATAAADRLRVVAPWRPEQRLVAMWAVEERHETTEAIAMAQFLCDRYSGDANVLRKSGLVLMRQGALEQSESALDLAARLSPGDYRNLVALAVVREKRGTNTAFEDWTVAMRSQIPLRYLEDAWRVLPDGLVWLDVFADSPRAAAMSSAWGAYLVRRGDTATALLAYEQAALISPNTRHAYHPTFIALLAEFKRHDEALTRAYAGREASPESEKHIRLIVNLLSETGQFQLALDTYRQNIKSHPKLVAPYLGLLSQEKGLDATFLELERIALTNGANPEAAMAVAAMFAETGQLKRCRDALRVGQPAGMALTHDAAATLVNRCNVIGSGATTQGP